MAERLPREPLPLTAPIPAGVQLVRQGEPARSAWIVVRGLLIERAVTSDGHVLVRDLPGPGDLVGGGGGPSPVTVTTVRRSVLRPPGTGELEPGIAERERRTLALAHDLAWLTTTKKLERRLHDLAARHGRRSPTGIAIGITLTQEDLAALTGTTRESANRAIQILIMRGVIERTARSRYVVRPPRHLLRR